MFPVSSIRLQADSTSDGNNAETEGGAVSGYEYDYDKPVPQRVDDLHDEAEHLADLADEVEATDPERASALRARATVKVRQAAMLRQYGESR